MEDRIERGIGLRGLGWLGFFALILLAWAMMLRSADLAGVTWAGLPRAICALPMDSYPVLLQMWGAMMLAMMGPVLVPALADLDAMAARLGNGRALGLWLALGYGCVWAVGAAGFAALQLGLLRAGLVDQLGIATSGWLAAALLLLAGAYQFTATKDACRDGCVSPVQVMLGSGLPGPVGAWRMGMRLGLACVGCCWAIMALAFVGGTMSVLWMGLATLFMVMEKLPALSRPITRPAGIVLILAGLAMGGWSAGVALAAIPGQG